MIQPTLSRYPNKGIRVYESIEDGMPKLYMATVQFTNKGNTQVLIEYGSMLKPDEKQAVIELLGALERPEIIIELGRIYNKQQ